ncbi:MAG: BACON domain-containing protein, partial [Prevotellaceae bacterium]|nr:BACON domain-containing protein [Prevotellaceae bacterium]
MKGKNIIFSMLLIAATMFAGCEKDPAEKTQKAITVADSKSLTQEVFADELQGAEGVTVVTTGAWTSSISEKSAAAKSPQMRVTADAPAWISITPESGDKAGSYTISISLVPNTTGADRAAVITISCNGTDITISVTQKATKKDGTKPVTKRIVEFEVYACNAQWSPENNIPYIVAEGAHISVYKSSDDDPVEDYSTDENGRVAFEFEPGDYVYRVLWSNEGKRVQNVSRQGFVIAGIFTSQEEIDNSPMQSDAKPGNLKFADINGDGIINDNDKVYDELVSLHVDANENESKMQVKTYIAPYDFLIEEEIPYSLILQALEEEFTEMLRESYLIDAAITHQASLPQPYDVFGNFTFDANDNRILQLWRQSYKVISSANMLIEKTNDDVPVEDRVGAIYRA